jgi:hypothetical protein
MAALLHPNLNLHPDLNLFFSIRKEFKPRISPKTRIREQKDKHLFPIREICEIGGEGTFCILASRTRTAVCKSLNSLTVKCHQNDPVWQKNGGCLRRKMTYFCDFSLLRGFYSCKPLPGSNLWLGKPSGKNRA